MLPQCPAASSTAAEQPRVDLTVLVWAGFNGERGHRHMSFGSAGPASAELVVHLSVSAVEPELFEHCTVWRCSQITRAVWAEIPDALSKPHSDWRSLFDLLCVGSL